VSPACSWEWLGTALRPLFCRSHDSPIQAHSGTPHILAPWLPTPVRVAGMLGMAGHIAEAPWQHIPPVQARLWQATHPPHPSRSHQFVAPPRIPCSALRDALAEAGQDRVDVHMLLQFTSQFGHVRQLSHVRVQTVTRTTPINIESHQLEKAETREQTRSCTWRSSHRCARH